MTNERKSNYELLRIIAMLGILACHLSAHGIRHCTTDYADVIYREGAVINRFVAHFFLQGGGIGNALFFMITGFFMINKQNSEIKLSRVVVTSMFYAWFSIIVYGLAFLFKVEIPDLLLKDAINVLIKGLFIPASGGIWWFVTTYIFIVLLSPVINRVVQRMNGNRSLLFIILFWFLWYSIASLDADYAKLQGALFFYIVGASLSLHSDKIESIKVHIVLLISLGFIVLYGVFSFLSEEYLAFMDSEIKLLAMEKMSMLVATALFEPVISVCLFVGFSRLEFKKNKMINMLGKSTLGVYLLSDSPVTRSIIWNKIFKIDDIYMNSFFPIYSILVVAIVFLVCALFDLVRQKYIEPKMIRGYNKFVDFFEL